MELVGQVTGLDQVQARRGRSLRPFALRSSTTDAVQSSASARSRVPRNLARLSLADVGRLFFPSSRRPFRYHPQAAGEAFAFDQNAIAPRRYGSHSSKRLRSGSGTAQASSSGSGTHPCGHRAPLFVPGRANCPGHWPPRGSKLHVPGARVVQGARLVPRVGSRARQWSSGRRSGAPRGVRLPLPPVCSIGRWAAE